MPIVLYAADGVTETWNSDSVGGGVVATVRSYGPGNTDTLVFPAFAGRTATIVNLLQWPAPGDPGVALDYGPGYPRVTVSTAGAARRFAVVIT